MDAKQQFQAGHLAGAIEAVTAEVKSRPTDAASRAFLFELLCFAGELDRAQRQLDAIAHQDSRAEWPVQVYSNLLQAERARRRLFSEGLRPEFLGHTADYVQWHLDAVDRLREGRASEAGELLNRSHQARPVVAGTVNGRAADEICDCDDVLAPFLELLILRDYLWLPLDQLCDLEISPPERPRDLIWLPAKIVLADGSQRRGYLPTLYCGSHLHADDRVRLGRMTDWIQSGGGPIRGVGLHTLLVGEEALGLWDIRAVNCNPPPGA